MFEYGFVGMSSGYFFLYQQQYHFEWWKEWNVAKRERWLKGFDRQKVVWFDGTGNERTEFKGSVSFKIFGGFDGIIIRAG